MKTAIIVCGLDGYANKIKPLKIKEFLERNGYDVTIYSTSNISRLGNGKYSRLLPGKSILQLRLYILELLQEFAKIQPTKVVRKKLLSLILKKILETRGALLNHILPRNRYHLLICENNFDQAVVLNRIADIQILDLPTPFAEENYYGNDISPQSYTELLEFEKGIYRKADFISFHWHSYSDFVKKHKYSGKNFIDIGFGTNPQVKQARYSEKPKIVFLGYLGGYWSNPHLLEELSKQYPIDVYGGPRIPGLKINYKGYTPTSDILAEYQFGLISITDDPLRRIGFSAKHLDYFSYGLPVLVPEWREDVLLDGGSIHFNRENFLSLVHYYSDRDKWEEKKKAAVTIAETLNWDSILKPLKAII